MCRALARHSLSNRPYGFDTTKPSLPSDTSVQLQRDTALASVRNVRTALVRPSHSYRPHGFDTAKTQLSSRYAPTARGHDKALASPTRSLDLVCTKAWETLTTVSPTFHLVRNTKTRLSLSHSLARLYMTKLPTPTSTSTLLQCTMQSMYDSLLRTALALQHLALVRLAVRTSNRIDTPSVNPTYRQNREYRSTNHDRHQLLAIIIHLHSTTQPTSVSSYDHPAASNDPSDLSFQLWSSSFFNDSIKLRQLPATNVQLRSSTCREEENLIFCFGALFNSTLNFTQSGWHILFSPDLHFRLANRVSGQILSLQLETATGQSCLWSPLLSDAF